MPEEIKEAIVKKTRGRPRKTPLIELPDEIKQKEQQAEKQEFEQIKQEVIKESKGGWDFSKDDVILYFDATKSYEITGYKPINKTQGLDFRPEWFTETREVFLRTGHYCQFPRNTKAYNDFWDEQYRRCQNGMTVNGYLTFAFMIAVDMAYKGEKKVEEKGKSKKLIDLLRFDQ